MSVVGEAPLSFLVYAPKRPPIVRTGGRLAKSEGTLTLCTPTLGLWSTTTVNIHLSRPADLGEISKFSSERPT